MEYLFIAIGLSIGNFLWQMFSNRDLEKAVERSFFQTVACLCCWYINS